jgi:hypothetical protein
MEEFREGVMRDEAGQFTDYRRFTVKLRLVRLVGVWSWEALEVRDLGV